MPGVRVPSLPAAFQQRNILVGPEREDCASVFKTLVGNLVDAGRVTRGQAASALRAVNRREAVGSTAIGDGVALPHARVDFTDGVIGAFALLEGGADFKSLDGAPVRFVFLLLTPEADDELHTAFLRSVTRFTSVTIHRNALAGCKTPKDVYGVFKDYG